MSNFIKELITNKMKNLSKQEILSYSQQYGFNITQTEAKNISAYLKNNTLDPFDAAQRSKMFRDLAKITDHETSKKAQKLFNELVKNYGIDHMFR